MTSHKIGTGRLLGAILLIAGTAIGAAMLALPVATGRSGFIPSIFTMIFTWFYLTYAAFLILEVNLAMPGRVSLVTMATETLGRFGKIVSWTAYLFLLYALNTAYVAACSFLFKSLIFDVTGYNVAHIFTSLPLLVVFSLILRQGTHVMDLINRVFMFGLLITFILILGVSFPHVQVSLLEEYNLHYVVSSLSVVLTAFGFHVIIPTLVTYLHGNVKHLKKAIWIGSSIPLVVYILWQIAVLGLVPLKGADGIESAYINGINGAQLISELTHHSWIKSLGRLLSLFTIITSFLGVSLSLFDFLADGLKVEKRASGKWKLFFFTFVPPLYFALSSPNSFFSALEYAGAFGVVILLALLPACMVWSKRYNINLSSPYKAFGGKIILSFFIAISLALVALEVLRKIGILA